MKVSVCSNESMLVCNSNQNISGTFFWNLITIKLISKDKFENIAKEFWRKKFEGGFSLAEYENMKYENRSKLRRCVCGTTSIIHRDQGGTPGAKEGV